MRMSKTGPSARDLVNTYSVEDLSRIIREFGRGKIRLEHRKKYRKSEGKSADFDHQGSGGNHQGIDALFRQAGEKPRQKNLSGDPYCR